MFFCAFLCSFLCFFLCSFYAFLCFFVHFFMFFFIFAFLLSVPFFGYITLQIHVVRLGSNLSPFANSLQLRKTIIIKLNINHINTE